MYSLVASFNKESVEYQICISIIYKKNKNEFCYFMYRLYVFIVIVVYTA